jgi:hypothetical protein
MPLVTGFIPPCIPTRAHRVPSGPDWVHEIKHDGYRLQVRREGDAVRLFTRRGHDWSGRYPAIVMTAMQLRATSFTLDGEAVVCGPDGVAIFDALHRRGTVSEAMLYAYLLALEGQILLSLQYPQFALSSDKIVFGDAEVIGTEEGVGGVFGQAGIFGGDTPIAASPFFAIVHSIEHGKLLSVFSPGSCFHKFTVRRRRSGTVEMPQGWPLHASLLRCTFAARRPEGAVGLSKTNVPHLRIAAADRNQRP